MASQLAGDLVSPSHADDYDDKLSPDLQVLVDKADLPPESLESERKPKDFDGPGFIYIASRTLEPSEVEKTLKPGDGYGIL